MKKTIICNDVYNKQVEIEASRAKFRLAAYAYIVNDKNQLLVVRVKNTGKFWLPGGAVENDELMEDGLRRETMEEVGIEIVPQKFISYHQHFIYFNPEDELNNQVAFYFSCKPLSLEITGTGDEGDHAARAIDPQWQDIDSLKADDFHVFGQKVLDDLKKI
jgi:8-oxo-dGTP pyrophosphatase MutT (NUDIX family)